MLCVCFMALASVNRYGSLLLSRPTGVTENMTQEKLTNDHPLGPDAFDRYGVPYILMHRGDLHAALYGLVPDKTIRYSHKLCGLDQSDVGVTS